MSRLSACLVFMQLVGCSAKPPDRERARIELMSYAEKMRQAMRQEDHQQIADLTYTAVVVGAGGREAFIKRVADTSEEMKSKGFGITDVTYTDPSDLVDVRGSIYAILPFNLRLYGPGGATGIKPSYLICVSSDAGLHWKFFDGEGLSGDRSVLRQLLPDFPDQLVLPSKQDPRWKD